MHVTWIVPNKVQTRVEINTMLSRVTFGMIYFEKWLWLNMKKPTVIWFAHNKCSESASVQSMLGSDYAHLCPCFCVFCYILPIITPQATYCFKHMADFQHCELDCLKYQTQGGLVLARSLVNHVLGCVCVFRIDSGLLALSSRADVGGGP